MRPDDDTRGSLTRLKRRITVTEYAFTWDCPHCAHVNNDSVHPEHGPYCNLICGGCERSGIEQRELNAASAQSWESAMAQADATERR